MSHSALARPPRSAKQRLSGQVGVLVLSGYGLRLAVERGHLLLEDGIADSRRVLRLSRANRSLKRITVICHAGTISLDAIRWLNDVKVPLVHLDTDGRVLAVVAPEGPDHPRLRRAQAVAAGSPVGVEVMREVLDLKLRGQLGTLELVPPGQLAVPAIQRARQVLSGAKDFLDLRAAEAQAAAAYWGIWAKMPVRFRQPDLGKVPDHWLTFGPRASALTGSPRLAVNPANALLNYLYAILEAEARLALLAVGCDPGLGILHADQRARDSMACDVMEAVRPAVDRWLFNYLRLRELARSDFLELRNGNCRLTSGIASELGQTTQRWAEQLAPVVERVAEMLHQAGSASPRRGRRTLAQLTTASTDHLPTPLTERYRRVGRGQAKATREDEVRLPVNTPDDWLTRERFLREVVPVLREMSILTIAQGVGLSAEYCAKIRAGRGIPHRSHWASFARLVSTNADNRRREELTVG